MTDEIKFWSARPFVSHAGPDGNGFRQEVLVTKGVAPVINIEDKGNTAKVEMQVPGRKYSNSGWINTDTEAFRIAKEAFENGNAPIEYRIEHHRKIKDSNNVPISPETPIYELMGADEDGNNPDNKKTNEFTRKLLVGIANPGGEMQFSQELTDPAEDPQYGQGRPSNARFNKGTGTAEPKASGATVTAGGPVNDVESAPYTALNADGRVNPGSTGSHLPVELYFFLLGLENGGKAPELTDKRRKMLVNAMLASAGTIQMHLYDGGLAEPDREVGSFRNIIETMKSTVRELHPLTDEAVSGREAVDAWMQELTAETEQLTQYGIANYTQSLGN